MSIWRKIWQECITIGKETLLRNDQKGKLFEELREKYPNDAMVIFEEAITFDCMKNYKRAIELYQTAFNELPVNHWKDNANYLLQKARIKSTNQIIPKLTLDDVEKLKTAELSENDFKMFGYFYLHGYYHLPDNVRQLAISSMSMIDTESAMSIAIFRTCVEVTLKETFKLEYTFTDDDNLAYVLKKLEQDNQIEEILSVVKKLRDYGNDAIHQAKNFEPKEIAKIIVFFDTTMEYLNLKLKELAKSKINRIEKSLV